MKVIVEGDRAIVNKKIIIFDQNVDKYIELKNGDVIFLLDIPMDCNEINNLYCYSFNGKFKWRIKPNEFEIKGQNCWPYVGLNMIEGEFFVVDFYGRRFFFDPENGEIIRRDVVK
ncbi:hypothetical protein [Aquitalea denitrificans]|uniref:hypothetical protein n=1 Tax=Aquitalea denitrificans TaxID=519081 RepID=UPI00135B49E6|nr:hypothetical protein [Aquitalea denitrificans]